MAVVRRFTGQNGNLDWDNAPVYNYEGATLGASRRTLIGPEDGARYYDLRYFEIQPGGWSSFDEHAHDHGVYVLRGQGSVLLGEDMVEIGPGDVIYIPPFEKHWFHASGEEPLGFLCVAPPKTGPGA